MINHTRIAAPAAAALGQVALPSNGPWQTYQLLRLLGSAALTRCVGTEATSVDAALPSDCQRLSGEGPAASFEAAPTSCRDLSQRQETQKAIWPFSGSARGLATWSRERDRDRGSSRGDSSSSAGPYGTWDERIVGGRAPDRGSNVRGWNRQGNDWPGRGRGAGAGDDAGGRRGSRLEEKLNNWQQRVRQFEYDAAALCRRLEAASSWEELTEAVDLAPEPLLVGEQVVAALQTYCRLSNAQRPRRQPGSSRSSGSGSGGLQQQRQQHHNQQQPAAPPSPPTAPPAQLTDRLRKLLAAEASGLKLRPLAGALFAFSTLPPEARQGLTHGSAPGAENPLPYMLNRLEFLLGQKAAAAEGAAAGNLGRDGGKGAGSRSGQQQGGGRTEAEAEGQAAARVSGAFVSYLCTALRKLHAATPALQRHLAALAAPALGRDLTGDYLAGVVLAFSRADTPDALFLEKALHASAHKLSLQQLSAPFYACVLLDAASRVGLTEPKVLDPLADRLVQLVADSRKQAARQGAAREGQTHGSRAAPQKRKQEARPAGAAAAAERDGYGGLGPAASTSTSSMGELGFRSVDALRVLTACDTLSYTTHRGLLQLLQEELWSNRSALPLQMKLQAAQHLLGLGVDVLEQPPAQPQPSSPSQPDQDSPAAQLQPPTDEVQRVRTHTQCQTSPLHLDSPLEQDSPAPGPPASNPGHLAPAAAMPEAAAGAGARAEAVVVWEPLVTEAEVLAFLKRPELMVAELTVVLQALVRLRGKKPGGPLALASSPSSHSPTEATAAPEAAAAAAAGEVAMERGPKEGIAPIPATASAASRTPAVRMPRALATAVHLVDAAALLMKPHHIAGALSALLMAGAVVPPAILLRAQALHAEAAEAGAAGAGGDAGSQRQARVAVHEGTTQQQQQQQLQQDRSQGQLRPAMRGAELRGMCAAVGRVLAWQPSAAAAANLSDGFIQSCRAAAWEGGRHT